MHDTTVGWLISCTHNSPLKFVTGSMMDPYWMNLGWDSLHIHTAVILLFTVILLYTSCPGVVTGACIIDGCKRIILIISSSRNSGISLIPIGHFKKCWNRLHDFLIPLLLVWTPLVTWPHASCGHFLSPFFHIFNCGDHISRFYGVIITSFIALKLDPVSTVDYTVTLLLVRCGSCQWPVPRKALVGAEAVVSLRFRKRDKSLKPSMLLFINYDKENNNNPYDDNCLYLPD